ncbi:MAG: enoyl-ACP reductase, partial [Flavobacteriales bacterium]
SDLTRYVTMQNLYHDGGFSSTGATPFAVEKFNGEPGA